MLGCSPESAGAVEINGWVIGGPARTEMVGTRVGTVADVDGVLGWRSTMADRCVVLIADLGGRPSISAAAVRIPVGADAVPVDVVEQRLGDRDQ